MAKAEGDARSWRRLAWLLGAGLMLVSAIPAPAADLTPAEILAVGQVVERLGSVASFLPAQCLGADGRVGTAVAAAGGQRALACGDASGFKAIVREGDPSPRGGLFVDFPGCALPASGEVFFVAGRRFPPGPNPVRDLYRATPDGIEWVVGPGATAADGTTVRVLDTLNDGYVPGGVPLFAVNERGTVLVRAHTANGRVFMRVRRDGPPEVLQADYAGGPWNSSNAGIAGDDTVLALARLASGEPTIVALDGDQARTLVTRRDIGLVDGTSHSFSNLVVSGELFGFNAFHFDTVVFRGTRQYLLYTPQRGLSPLLDPAVYDDVFVFDLTAGGRALFVGRIRDERSGEFVEFTDYALLDERGVTLVGRRRNSDFFPPALALNDRGNVLLQTRVMPDADVRQSLALSGPPPEARCFVPPTAVPVASATHTPTPTPIDCAATTDDPRCVRLQVGSASGEPGQRVAIDVRLYTGRNEVAGVQNDLHFAAAAPFDATDSGQPDCRVNPAIHKDRTAASFLPVGCRAGADCERLRIVVLAFDNVAAIPDGSTLYTCGLTITADASPGISPIAVSEIGFSDPQGKPLLGTASPGAIEVLASRDTAVVAGAAGGGDGCRIGAANTVALWPALLLAVLVTIRNRRR